MTENFKIIDILKLLKQSTKNSHLNINGIQLTPERANEILISFIENFIYEISKNQSNIKIEKLWQLKQIKSPEEINAMRWFNEAKSFPTWYKRTNLRQSEIFDNHTKVVAKQTILLSNFLELTRETQKI